MPDVVRVAVENAASGFDILYSYRVPDKFIGKALPGCRVTVPFGRGNTRRFGLIFSLEAVDADGVKGLKSVISVSDEEPLLSEEMLALALWLKERTFCTLFEAAKAMLPSGINQKLVVSYAADASKSADAVLLDADSGRVYDYLLNKTGYVRREALLTKFGLKQDSDVAERLYAGGFLVRNTDAVREVGDLTKKMLRLTELGEGETEALPKLTTKQETVRALLAELGSASVKELCYFTGFTPSVPMSLVGKGVAESYDIQVFRNPYQSVDDVPEPEAIELTSEQLSALDSLLAHYNSHTAHAALLYGVTGSGKTKVYMRLIDEVVTNGDGVIVMVPEIALTPQLMSLFHARYGKKVAVFHSALSVGERIDEWRRVKSGECLIAVGTRSAVFAPFDKLGLIVIDEEQEHTYKSDRSPRYHARDVAKFRCARHNAVLLLASATPSVESFAAARSGRYELLTLTERYGGASLPEVVTVDMCTECGRDGKNRLSTRLVDELRSCLSQGHQAILLVNRRGYNTFASCRECGHVITCPSCSISMTYHHANDRLMCHYCGYSVPFTQKCPSCEADAVKYSGYGTQKLEEEISSLLPDARVLRMDTDTTMTRRAHETKLESFGRGEYDILLGTQMVAKGLDFENVTLVGVISVDGMLYNDEYKSLERTFDLLTQVVGRSGRGRYPGKAIIQTLTPENEIIALAARQDYEAFYDTEISVRRSLIYPPFCDICVVALSGEDELHVRAGALRALEILKVLSSGKYASEKLIVLGPMPSKVSKISNRFRHRMIIKCRNTDSFRKMISELLTEFEKDKRFSAVSIYCDINPENIN